ncbi:MAG: hypothetical protein HYY03_02310 [Chloroflexi bacterium]|nr:hypothetical protein [Chloroflexota bacterium]
MLRRRPERDPAPFIIGGTIAFVALVIGLVFVFSSLLGGGGDNRGEISGLPAGIKGRLGTMPRLPPGLVAVSDFVEFETEKEITAEIQLPLNQRVEDPAQLGFYTFLSSRWQRVADVELVEGGVRGKAEFRSVPGNLAVLQVAAQAYQVAGSLPAGGSLHPDAKVNILSPRDYRPAADGSVQGTATPLQVDAGVLLMPTIVGSGQDAAAAVDNILADGSLRAAHIQAIVGLAQQGQLAAIDLEYSSVDSALGAEFTEFVQGLSEALHQGGARLSLTLPPPTGQRQAYDWQALGQAVDIIKVLPIADPVAYWEKMPDALNQITEDVAPNKVMLVLSPFSVERTGSVARPVGYQEAMVLAAQAVVREPGDPEKIKPGVTVKLVAANLDDGEGASPLRWSDNAAAVTFSLGGGQNRTIFVENGFSVRFKLEMVEAYGLGGVAVADASAQSDVANVWPAVNELASSATVTLLRPNDDTLLPRWQAPDGGDLGAGAGTTATWIAPSVASTYTLVLIVSDGERRFGRRTTVEVKGPPSTPTAVPTFTPEATATPTPTPSATAAGTAVQVGILAEGDDADGQYTNNETVSPGSTVTYLVTFDNDSPEPVTIVSLVDDVYGNVTCLDSEGEGVLGQTLKADDGDGPQLDGGPDEVQCTFTAKAPSQSGETVKNTITGTIKDAQGNEASDEDDATITTAVAGSPSPSPSP